MENMVPQISFQDTSGYHNSTDSNARLLRGNTYKDASTVCIIPTRGLIHAKVVQSWMSMMTPMNQKFFRIFMMNMEVGDAYNAAIESSLSNPELSKWKYVLTLEEDNMPPPDGLIKLYEGMTTYDVIGGLYWTKGEGGQPMIYGDPKAIPLHFIPQVPQQDTIQACCGLGMGFTLFKMDIFKDKKMPKPWFKTCQEVIPGVGSKVYTQDLYFFENAHRLGYKMACDTRVKVGHYAVDQDIVW
jgi:hypothetical protein